MANLSQIKREQMLAFLETLKEQHNDDESLIAINQIEKELTSKKYGLVWEQHEENVDVMMRTHIPVFTEVKDREIVGAPDKDDFNFLLEGDNLHSLKLLEKTHKGRVDVIYIDPPYNTGSEDFKYDDQFIDELDGYRHSKWISFMNTRLRIAHELLSDDGVIMVSIDENEYAQLKMLMDEIFGDNNRLSVHHVQVRYENKTLNEKNDWQPVMEYILIYAKNSLLFSANKPYETYSVDKFVYEIKEGDRYEEEEIGGKVVKIFKKGDYQIIKHDQGEVGLLKGTWASGSVVKGNASGKYFETYLKPRKEIDGLSTLYKVEGIGEDGLGYRYFTGPQKANATQGLFYSGIPLVRLEEMKQGTSKKYKPIQNHYDFSPDFGNIRQEGGIPFNSGKKPVKMLKMLINYHKNKNAIVLDFFAGSGSTGHAVCELNAEDGGNRRFMLCTNNESNICEEVTYARIQNVINGYGKNAPLSANLMYYKTDYVDKACDDLINALVEHIKEMIQIQFGVKVDNKRFVIIMDDDEMDSFEKDFGNYDQLKAVFISQDVLMTTSQEQLLEGINTFTIPDCYFDFELREAGELW